MTKTFKDYLKEAENESGLQYYTGVKKHGKEYMKKAAKAGREGASQEELGRLKDKYSKAAKKKESMEEAIVASKYHCKDCGDTMHKPTTDCKHDSHDEKGRHWIDDNGNGIHDADEGIREAEDYCDCPCDCGKAICESCGKKHKKKDITKETEELNRIKELAGVTEETYDGDDFYHAYGDMWFNEDEIIDEAEYQGRKVQLGKPTRGDVKKFKVYVRDPKTKNIKKVNFGDPNMKIKKSNPARRRSFRARHNCDNPGPRTKARYWSCRKW